MNKILSVIGGGSVSMQSRDDDDFADRVSHRYTTLLLVAFAFVVVSKQYVGEPINCWVPAHFTGNHEAYTNDYCWIKNTYYLPFEEYIPKEHEDDKRNMIPYYQWVPLILLVQAIFFFMPCLIWRSFSSRSGIDVNNIVQSGQSFQGTQKHNKRGEILEHMTSQLLRYLHISDCKGNGQGNGAALCGKSKGNFLVTLYIIVKFLYLLNILGQLFLLNEFLGSSFHMYGVTVLTDLIWGQWTTSDRFPRVTMCDFRVRRLGNVQRYTVQCVLPINLFNEKIYLFVYFWFVFAAIITFFSILVWIMRLSSLAERRRYIKKHLKLKKSFRKDEDKRSIRRSTDNFLNKCLKLDGYFVMRLIGHNTNAITVSDTVDSMYQSWRKVTGDDDEPPRGMIEMEEEAPTGHHLEPPSHKSPLAMGGDEHGMKPPTAPTLPLPDTPEKATE